MNPDEFAREVAGIRNTRLWPHFPLLPVKNIVKPGGAIGIVHHKWPSRVYHYNLFELDDLARQLGKEWLVPLDLEQHLKFTDYATIEEMVGDGWVGD